MTCLSIIRSVTQRLSLPTPAMVVGSPDRQVQQLLALANEEGEILAKTGEKPWQAITEEFNFVTVAAAAQPPAAIPADFDYWIPNSFFNRTTRREVSGPFTPYQWQLIQAQPIYATVILGFRERGGVFLVAPVPPAGQEIYGEYVSLNWAKSATGVAQPAFLADSDTSFLSEVLIGLGLRWRYLKAKGLEYGEDMATYEREVEKALARDGGMTALSMAPQPVDLSRVNLPDGNFGLV